MVDVKTEDGEPKTTHGADLLLEVARAKHAAATADPGADRSKANLEKARREGWTTSDGSR